MSSLWNRLSAYVLYVDPLDKYVQPYMYRVPPPLPSSMLSGKGRRIYQTTIMGIIL